ncbi:hypothetical protein ACOMSG_13230 [Macellibacteroides fermentans]|uniref:hypothetical protein n=1 Tax=Macellibacteroides fermentans TaxID=879969 RepID=UPI003B9410E9
MKKRTGLMSALGNMPYLLKEAANLLKGYISNHGVEVLNTSGGTLALALKFIVNPIVDKYKEIESTKKLENFGLNTYLNAAYQQAKESVESIENEIKIEITTTDLISFFDDNVEKSIEVFNTSDIAILFQPEYHPLIIYVRNQYESILDHFGVEEVVKKKFKRHFGENIEKTIKSVFGECYDGHRKTIEEYWLESNESKLLYETIHLNKIGFDRNENLKYEQTMGYWCEISHLTTNNGIENKEREFIDEEDKLRNIEDMIKEYFDESPDDHTNQILFIIADFGKGKSVFLKQFASKLARKYIEERDGYFPVYFNLREYSSYMVNSPLGVIDEFLQTKYKIDIKDPYFKKKKYYFLIDSLDESGELNSQSIGNVISSIKQIQNLDKTKYTTNRIIVTSRPFNDGLCTQLRNYKPHTTKNPESRDIAYCASLYGFKKTQFNDWLTSAFQSQPLKNNDETIPLVKDIFDSIKNNKSIDIYNNLNENATLSKSELKRPIFAYMIYQLLLNNVNILKIGKIGIYLSFLNLLTKEAKHINDKDYHIKLNEEFEFRNLLHSIAALWMYERQRGNQGMLKKADICRVLDGKNNHDADDKILLKYKDQKVIEIEFLSHSYFGENNNMLHFQHQSFAEILLAEYYLKVIIKYALDCGTDIDEARSKLVLGIPTNQTFDFLTNLLTLLKETSVDLNTQDIIEKRKLLYPLIASISIEHNNNLFCNDIYYSWYRIQKFEENRAEYPEDSLVNWPIKKEHIDKILCLCAKILNSTGNTLLTKVERKNALFDEELIIIKNNELSNICLDTDKWIALLVGNILHTDKHDPTNIKLFNTDYKINPKSLFDLIITSNYTDNNGLIGNNFKRVLFSGIDMRENTSLMDFQKADFEGYDFSYSYFKNIFFMSCLFDNTIFNNCSFVNTIFLYSRIMNTRFYNIKTIESTEILHSMCDSILITTLNIERIVNFKKDKNSKQQDRISIIYIKDYNPYAIIYAYKCIYPFYKYYIDNEKIHQDDVYKIFKFNNKKIEDQFIQSLINNEPVLNTRGLKMFRPYEKRTSNEEDSILTIHIPQID